MNEQNSHYPSGFDTSVCCNLKFVIDRTLVCTRFRFSMLVTPLPCFMLKIMNDQECIKVWFFSDWMEDKVPAIVIIVRFLY